MQGEKDTSEEMMVLIDMRGTIRFISTEVINVDSKVRHVGSIASKLDGVVL